MCMICAELAKNTLTVKEARRNLGEVYTELDRDHVHEILRLLWQKEDEQYESIKDEGSD